MDPTTSFVMALVAIVVSAISALAALLAVGQNSRYHPKPFFNATVHEPDEMPVLSFTFRLVNMGQTAAHDVQLAMRSPTALENLWYELELKPTSPHDATVSTVTGSSRGEWSPRTMDETADGEPMPMKIQIELSWRQWPAMKRKRVMRWRVEVNEFGHATMRTGRERGALSTAFVEIWQGVADAFSEAWWNVKRLF